MGTTSDASSNFKGVLSGLHPSSRSSPHVPPAIKSESTVAPIPGLHPTSRSSPHVPATIKLTVAPIPDFHPASSPVSGSAFMAIKPTVAPICMVKSPLRFLGHLNSTYYVTFQDHIDQDLICKAMNSFTISSPDSPPRRSQVAHTSSPPTTPQNR